MQICFRFSQYWACKKKKKKKRLDRFPTSHNSGKKNQTHLCFETIDPYDLVWNEAHSLCCLTENKLQLQRLKRSVTVVIDHCFIHTATPFQPLPHWIPRFTQSDPQSPSPLLRRRRGLFKWRAFLFEALFSPSLISHSAAAALVNPPPPRLRRAALMRLDVAASDLISSGFPWILARWPSAASPSVFYAFCSAAFLLRVNSDERRRGRRSLPRGHTAHDWVKLFVNAADWMTANCSWFVTPPHSHTHTRTRSPGSPCSVALRYAAMTLRVDTDRLTRCGGVVWRLMWSIIFGFKGPVCCILSDPLASNSLEVDSEINRQKKKRLLGG